MSKNDHERKRKAEDKRRRRAAKLAKTRPTPAWPADMPIDGPEALAEVIQGAVGLGCDFRNTGGLERLSRAKKLLSQAPERVAGGPGVSSESGAAGRRALMEIVTMEVEDADGTPYQVVSVVAMTIQATDPRIHDWKERVIYNEDDPGARILGSVMVDSRDEALRWACAFFGTSMVRVSRPEHGFEVLGLPTNAANTSPPPQLQART